MTPAFGRDFRADEGDFDGRGGRLGRGGRFTSGIPRQLYSGWVETYRGTVLLEQRQISSFACSTQFGVLRVSCRVYPKT